MNTEIQFHPSMIEPGHALKLGDARMIRNYFGKEQWGVFAHLLRDNPPDYLEYLMDPDPERSIEILNSEKWRCTSDFLDGHFLDNLVRRYALDGREHAMDVYLRQIHHANQTVANILSLSLPRGSERKWGLYNEVSTRTDSPSRLIAKAFGEPDERERFEYMRAIYLAEISIHLHERSRESKPYNRNEQVQALLNAHLFDQNTSRKTQEASIRTIHDNTTNKCLGRYICGEVQNGTHIKSQDFAMRSVKDRGWVHTQPRVKTDPACIEKVVFKAARDKRIARIADASDLSGIMLVAMGDKYTQGSVAMRDWLAERTLDILTRNYNGTMTFVEDHIIDGRSKAPELPWLRYQLYFGDQETPTELILYDEKNYMDSRMLVGDINDPRVPNRAHQLYQITRAQASFPLLFPESIYHYDELKLNMLMKIKLQSEAFNLIHQDRI